MTSTCCTQAEVTSFFVLLDGQSFRVGQMAGAFLGRSCLDGGQLRGNLMLDDAKRHLRQFCTASEPLLDSSPLYRNRSFVAVLIRIGATMSNILHIAQFRPRLGDSPQCPSGDWVPNRTGLCFDFGATVLFSSSRLQATHWAFEWLCNPVPYLGPCQSVSDVIACNDNVGTPLAFIVAEDDTVGHCAILVLRALNTCIGSSGTRASETFHCNTKAGINTAFPCLGDHAEAFRYRRLLPSSSSARPCLEIFPLGDQLRALNTGIGSSGTRALTAAPGTQQKHLDFDSMPLCAWVLSFYTTFYVLASLCVVKLLLRKIPICRFLIPHFLWDLTGTFSVRIALPIGRIGSAVPCLDWTPHAKSMHCKPKAKYRAECSRPGIGRNSVWGVFLYSLPFQVWAAPPGAPAIIEAIGRLSDSLPEAFPAPTIISAPCASEPPSDGSWIESVSVNGLTLQSADAEHWPTLLSQPCYRTQTVDDRIARRIAYPVSAGEGHRLTGSLGVSIYAPNYQTELWAVYVSRGGSLQDLNTSVRSLLVDAFQGCLGVAVPLIPQLQQGSAQYLAYPRFLDADGSLGVAVVFDLRHVGGKIFAAVTARVQRHSDLVDILRPLAPLAVDVCDLYIGSFGTPCGAAEHVVLNHGTVISVFPPQEGPLPDFAISDLFRKEETWSPISSLLGPLQVPNLCVLAGHRSIVVSQASHAGCNIPDAVSAVLDKSKDEYVMCSDCTFQDLDVRGHACDRVIATAFLHPLPGPPESEGRQEAWIFCDYRPLGRGPKSHLLHAFRVHVPSLLALDDIRIPPEVELVITGGVLVGEDVILEAQTTLTFSSQPITQTGADDISCESPAPSHIYADCEASDSQVPSQPGEDNSPELRTADSAQLPKHCVIYQAGFQAHYLLVYVSVPCSADTFTRAALDLAKSSVSGHHLVATRPQISAGLATLVAVPAWTYQTDKTVIVLDFLACQGPVYALLTWRYVTRDTLAADARRHVQSPWQVYHYRHNGPLSSGAHIKAEAGDVFVFQVEPACPREITLLEDKVTDAAAWDPCPPTIPRESPSHRWLVLRSHVTRTPSFSGTDFDELRSIAAEASDSDAADLDFELIGRDSPLQELVYHGFAIRGVLAAWPRSDSGNRHGIFVFLDTRLIGRQPSFRYCTPGWIKWSDLFDFPDVPSGLTDFCIAAKGVLTDRDKVLVYDGCTVVFGYEASIPLAAASPSSGPGTGDAATNHGLGADNPGLNTRPRGPTRFRRDTPSSPDPEDLLQAEPREEEIEVTAETVSACFLVFAPRFQVETYTIEVDSQCTLDQVLGAIADLRDSGCSEFFNELIPAFPQPDVQFGSVIAAPPWAQDQCCVLIDARAHNGRMFSTVFNGRLNRKSVLLHIQLPDEQGFDLYCGRIKLEDSVWRSFIPGETVTVQRTGELPRSPVTLADMLRDVADWTSQPPSFEGPHFPAFCVMSDGNQKVILVDVEQTRSFSDFRRLSAATFQHTSGQVNVCSSQPRVTDFAVLGQNCKAILVATEAVQRLQIPPARLRLMRTIAFVDCRLLLREFTWTAVDQGLPDVEAFVESHNDGIPPGYSINVKGATTEVRFGRNFLRVPNGTLLTLTLVADDSSGTETSAQDSDPDPDSDESTAVDENIESLEQDATAADTDRGAISRDRSRSRSPYRDGTNYGFEYLRKGLLQRCLCCQWTSASVGTVAKDALAVSCAPDKETQPHGPVHHDIVSNALPVWLFCKHPGFVSAKILNEPSATTPSLQRAIAFLRYAAPRLGREWRYRAPSDAVYITPDSDTESSEETSEEISTLHFLLLTPGFAPKHIVLQLRLPVTINEALRRVQAARHPDDVRIFSSLVPASPQPCPGSGVCIALPAWSTSDTFPKVFLCLDTSAFDGRLFACASPPYVSRRQLLRLASLGDEIDIDVHFGDDPVPITDEGEHQVGTGETIVFLPVGRVVPTLLSLAIALFAGSEWSQALTAPIGTSENSYCIVHKTEAILYTTSFQQPTAFRNHIAACVGINSNDLRIFPSAPRVADAALDGFSCKTVIAVCESLPRQHDSTCGVLVDSRAILLGWQTYEAIGGQVSCIRIRVALQREAPPGWRVHLGGISDDTDLLPVHPGQVIVVFVTPSVRIDVSEQEPRDAQAGGGTPPAPGNVSRGDPAEGPDQDPRKPDDHEGPTDELDGGTGQNVDRDADTAHVTCTFLLLGQNYIAEHIEVRLPIGTSVEVALARVAAARAPQDVLRLPGVQAVYPQPHGSHALCVTTPEWRPQGAIVAIDCREVNGRLFSVQLTGTVDRAGLLNVAELPNDADVDVYIGNQPWPLVDGPSVNFFTGELVLFTNPQAPYHAVASLQDMLASRSGWSSNYDPARHIQGGYVAHTWLLSDQASEFFVLQPGRQQQVRQDIALHLGVSSRELVLQPAHLAAPDFAHRGIAASTVLAALRSTEFLPSQRRRHVVIFIDARPVLSTVTWKVCPEGLLDTGSLVSRFAAFSPAGHVVHVVRNNLTTVRLGFSIAVQDGEVFTVFFRPFQVSPSHDPTFHDPPDDGDDGEDGQDGHRGYRRRQAESNSRLSCYPASSADTGGTEGNAQATGSLGGEANDRQRSTEAVCFNLPANRKDKWNSSEDRTRLVDGTHCPTPAFPIAAPVRKGCLHQAPNTATNSAESRRLASGRSRYRPKGAHSAKRQCLAAEMWTLCFILQAILDGNIELTSSSLRWPISVLVPLILILSNCDINRRRRHFCELLFLTTCLAQVTIVGAVWHPGTSGVSIDTPTTSDSRFTAQIFPVSCIPYHAEVTARPIPTPCRAFLPSQGCLNAGHHTLINEEVQAEYLLTGPTLLEESQRRAEGRPLWEAVTLLETLVEHFTDTSHGNKAKADEGDRHVSRGLSLDQAHSQSDRAKKLRLSNCLPQCLSFDLTPVVLQAGRGLDEVVSLFNAKWSLSTDIPKDVYLHPATVTEFRQHIEATPTTDVWQFDVFTDGSYDGTNSSWAFAVFASGPSGVWRHGHAYGRVALAGETLYVGASSHSALAGERSALFWAQAWLLQKDVRIPARIWGDCLVALGQTHGSHQLGDDALAKACRSLAAAVESAGQASSAHYDHVRAHCGHPYNEFVDVLAKYGLRNDTYIPSPFDGLPTWVTSGDLDWLWLCVEATLRPTQWPQYRGNTFVDTGASKVPDPDLLRQCLDLGGSARQDNGIYDIRFQPKIVTVNVQTLQEDPQAGVAGRVPYIREQLDALGVALAGLQETRSKQSATVVSATHIRYTSQQDESGNLGVELWLSRTHPFAWRGKEPIFFQRDDVIVFYTSPRILLARYVHSGLRFFIAVLHAPTAADPTRDTWWKSLHDRLITTTKGEKIIILGDFNARLQWAVPHRIGDIVWERGPPAPPSLLKLFSALDVWAPSTFEGVHTGDSYTWVAPGQGSASRIDFILLPAAWQARRDGSYVLYEVDFGQKGVDHYGVALEVDFWLQSHFGNKTGVAKIDTSSLASHSAQAKLREICREIPAATWHTDAHTHYEHFAAYIRSSLASAFPARKSGPKRSYFSDSTWGLRQQRVALRKQIHRAAKLGIHAELMIAFHSWADNVSFCVLTSKNVGRILSSIRQLTQGVADLRALSPALRRSIQNDKKFRLDEIARQAAASTTKDVVQKLRPLLGPPKRKLRGAVALPLVELEDGSVATSKAKADQRWTRHFSSIEDGAPIECGEHIKACLQRQNELDTDSLELCRGDIPTLLDIERNLRSAHCGKAIGNDGVPPDLLHLQAANTSKAVYSVFLKTAFRMQEPIAWKGGTLHAIYKGRGSQADCANFRAILVSSSIGKAIHGTLRDKCAPLLEVACTPLQIGGRAGQPVQVATHLFVDLREAFHRVVRPLIHGGTLDDHHVAGIVRELGLGPDSVPRLHEYVREQSLLIDAGASSWTSQIIKEVGEDAWFTFGSNSCFARVRGGTRPGDNLADLVFTFLFAEIAKRIRRHFEEAGALVELPWNPCWLCQDDIQAEYQSTTSNPLDVTWMDDMSILLHAETPDQLVARLQLAATTTIDECLKAVLLPNLRAGKTEAIVSLHGKGATATARRIFAGKDPSLPLESPLWPDARLRLTASYKHLGGVLQTGGGLIKELRARIGSAWQAFNKHKRLVFGSPIVGASEKATLFTSLVESTLYYGSGTWSDIKPAELAKLQNCLLHMSRQMLRPRFSHDAACRLCGPNMCLLLLGLPRLQLHSMLRDSGTSRQLCSRPLSTSGPFCTTKGNGST